MQDRKPRRLTELSHYPKKQSNFMSSKTAASGVVVEKPLYTNNDEYVIVVATVRPLHLCVCASMSTCACAHLSLFFNQINVRLNYFGTGKVSYQDCVCARWEHSMRESDFWQ